MGVQEVAAQHRALPDSPHHGLGLALAAAWREQGGRGEPRHRVGTLPSPEPRSPRTPSQPAAPAAPGPAASGATPRALSPPPPASRGPGTGQTGPAGSAAAPAPARPLRRGQDGGPLPSAPAPASRLRTAARSHHRIAQVPPQAAPGTGRDGEDGWRGTERRRRIAGASGPADRRAPPGWPRRTGPGRGALAAPRPAAPHARPAEARLRSVPTLQPPPPPPPPGGRKQTRGAGRGCPGPRPPPRPLPRGQPIGSSAPGVPEAANGEAGQRDRRGLLGVVVLAGREGDAGGTLLRSMGV